VNLVLKHTAGLIAASLLAAALSFGQAVNGTLLGTVTDPTGAVAPGAKVTITEQNTGVSRTTETTQSGYYAFSDLRPGVYTVNIELAGFKKFIRQNVSVLVNSTIRVDAALQTGDVSESIQITAETPLLQTDRSDTGRKIETQQIVDMPLGFNRNFQGLLNLVPGTTRAFRPHSEFFNSQDSLSTQVNGQSRLSNNVQLEGIDNNQRTGLLTALIPPAEALQTVDITTSNYEASLGRAGGAVTNVLLKSGTNELHGSAYWYNRVSALGARGFFPASKPVTTYNYAGFTLGGPIVKNKTFIFGDYLRVADRRGQTDRFVLPTAAYKGGDLSASPTTIYDPNTGNPDGSGRQAFPNKIIPDSRISPIAKRILSLVPDPNIAGAGLGVNYIYNSTLVKDTDNFDVKLDHNATSNDNLSFRYSFQRPKLFDPPAFGLAGGPHGGGFQGSGVNKVHNAAINYNHIFSPTLIMEARFGVNRYRNDAQPADYGSNASEELGIRGVNLDQWTSGMTQIDVGGFANPLVGYSASLPWIRAETNFNLVNTWTKTFGSHTMKWGADVRRLRDDLQQTQTFNPRGRFQYREGTTGCAGNCSGPTAVGFSNSFASFLLDLPNQVGRDIAQFFPTWRQWMTFAFVQDKWQVSQKLTLDIGLRWEFYKPPTPAQPGGFANYDPATNNIILAGIGGNPSDMGLQKNWMNFAPRFGLAYRLNEKNVIRTGYGVSYVPFPNNSYAWDTYPVKQNNAYNQLNSWTPAVSSTGEIVNLGTGLPAPQPVVIPADGIITNANPNQSFDSVINLKFKEGYVQSWNLAWQRSLPFNFVFETAYVGNKGTRMPTLYNLNAGLVAGAGSAGQPLFAKFRRTADTNLRYVGMDNNYHSLQLKLDKRYSNGLLITTAYTWSKAMAEGGNDDGGLFNYIDPSRNYARTNFDRRHTFVQSYLWELPFGPGKHYLNSGPLSWVLGGWQLNGILTYMTGTPFHVTVPGTVINAPGTTNTANVNGPVAITGAINDDPWFDVSVFTQPAQSTLGNLGRNSLTGPGFFNLDASLFKQFRLTERFRAEFRAEGYSITNTPQFANPNTGFGASNFGKITGTLGTGNAGTQGGARAIQLGMRITF